MRFLKHNNLRGFFTQTALLGCLLGAPLLRAEPVFDKDVKPLLSNYCYDCHADGMERGGVSLDTFKSHDELLGNRELWFKVLKNLRAGIMPPAKKSQPSPEEEEVIQDWIKSAVFKIDPENIDPGRVTLRRLNRVEYRNTIRDLMGVDYNTTEEFPPDDTGYGFDTIGDVLTVSPLLLEKYLKAAAEIVDRAVPTTARVMRERSISGDDFRGKDRVDAESLSFYEAVRVTEDIRIKEQGDYKLIVNLTVNGAFDFDPGRCEFVFTVDGEERFREEYKWEDNKKFEYEFDEKWTPGTRELAFELKPLVPEEEKKTFVNLTVTSVRIEGPRDRSQWVKTENYDRFFPREEVPEDSEEKRAYAHEILERFAKKAFRRPAEEETLRRLVELAEQTYSAPGKSFEEGIAQSIVAILASPRFIFRIEETLDPDARFALLDEYALASRLSYFLWSTMPDEELFELADKNELRNNLGAQIKRMVKDKRSREFVENFTGQWLQVRDIEGIAINEKAVLFLEEDPAEFEDRESRRRFFRMDPRADLDRRLRSAMRRETQEYFEYIMREDRSLDEFLDSDYTFLNERLAEHYGIPGVEGDDMRKVELPEESPRGGLLTQGSTLVVTSNPTRTSAVKRGLFILDNILGTPPPPPPPDLPELEEAEKAFKDREPTLREALELHRSKSLCRSCHKRMDPLGFGLENFNALGMWREQERGQPIDASGQLVTGEEFNGVQELKHILSTSRRTDFYRCLTEKMLIYALGRGLEYYDVETVDRIVEKLEKEDGRFSVLLTGIIESAPFQKRRNFSGMTAVPAEDKSQSLASREP